MLQMSGVLEVQVAKLRRDALRMLLGTILGTATSNLWRLLEHFFGVAEDPDEEKAAEASSLMSLLKAQKEEYEQEEEAAKQSVSKGSETPTPSSSQQEESTTPKLKTLKEQKLKADDSFPSKCSLKEAQLFFPTGEGSMHQTGVSDNWIGERIKLGGYKGCYPCMGEKCNYVAQTRGVLCSHVHWVHLGIALGCRFCPEKCWWQARYWSEHMDKAHTNIPKFMIDVHPTPSEAESQVYVTEETIVIPAPGTIKVEPDTTAEGDEPEAKRIKYHQQQEHVLQLGADAILANPPSDQPHSSASETLGFITRENKFSLN